MWDQRPRPSFNSPGSICYLDSHRRATGVQPVCKHPKPTIGPHLDTEFPDNYRGWVLCGNDIKHRFSIRFSMDL